jgi:hypothetical protein
MKLLPQQLNYDLMWKCHALHCGKWNHEEAESCIKCAQAKPLQPLEAKSKQHLIRMLDTVIAYAQDNGLGTCAPTILRAVIIAYLTGSEGHLESMCRAFGMIHAMYRVDGDRILNFKNQWKDKK